MKGYSHWTDLVDAPMSLSRRIKKTAGSNAACPANTITASVKKRRGGGRGLRDGS